MRDHEFWLLIQQINNICQPLIKFIKFSDGHKPNMGHIYNCWFSLGESIDKLNRTACVPPSRVRILQELHAHRWAEAHSPMHGDVLVAMAAGAE